MEKSTQISTKNWAMFTLTQIILQDENIFDGFEYTNEFLNLVFAREWNEGVADIVAMLSKEIADIEGIADFSDEQAFDLCKTKLVIYLESQEQ